MSNTMIPVVPDICYTCHRSSWHGWSSDGMSQWACMPMQGRAITLITKGESTVPSNCHRIDMHEAILLSTEKPP